MVKNKFYNPDKDPSLIAYKTPLEFIIYKSKISGKNIYKKIFNQDYKESHILILYNFLVKCFYVQIIIYDYYISEIFDNEKEAFKYITRYRKYLFYNDFIKYSKIFIEENKYPLFINSIHPSFNNPIDGITYTGINWFLIYFYSNIEDGIKNENNFYPVNKIYEYNLEIDETKSFPVIIKENEKYLKLITPSSSIKAHPKKHIKSNTLVTSLNISNEINEEEKIFVNFFDFIIKGKNWIISNEEIIKIKNLILNDTERYIKIIEKL